MQSRPGLPLIPGSIKAVFEDDQRHLQPHHPMSWTWSNTAAQSLYAVSTRRRACGDHGQGQVGQPGAGSGPEPRRRHRAVAQNCPAPLAGNTPADLEIACTQMITGPLLPCVTTNASWAVAVALGAADSLDGLGCRQSWRISCRTSTHGSCSCSCWCPTSRATCRPSC